jgi:mersacidin/lichenicidin family type 2 lantibiotic
VTEQNPGSDRDAVYAAERIIKAWKDPEYRQSLPRDLVAMLPDNPAGIAELIALEFKQDEINEALRLTLATSCSSGWRCL